MQGLLIAAIHPALQLVTHGAQLKSCEGKLMD
jgi:hypothetical protein